VTWLTPVAMTSPPYYQRGKGTAATLHVLHSQLNSLIDEMVSFHCGSPIGQSQEFEHHLETVVLD
jgi:hypothetical protein